MKILFTHGYRVLASPQVILVVNMQKDEQVIFNKKDAQVLTA